MNNAGNLSVEPVAPREEKVKKVLKLGIELLEERIVPAGPWVPKPTAGWGC